MSKMKNAVPATEESQPTRSNRPSHGVYVVEGENSFWTKVGAAWPHQDGRGFNIQLTAVPLAGRLVIREAKERE